MICNIRSRAGKYVKTLALSLLCIMYIFVHSYLIFQYSFWAFYTPLQRQRSSYQRCTQLQREDVRQVEANIPKKSLLTKTHEGEERDREKWKCARHYCFSRGKCMKRDPSFLPPSHIFRIARKAALTKACSSAFICTLASCLTIARYGVIAISINLYLGILSSGVQL